MPGAVLGRSRQRPRCLWGPPLYVLIAALLPPMATGTVDTGQAQCCSSIMPEVPPNTYYGATAIREGDPRGQWQPYSPRPIETSESAKVLLEHVGDIEGMHGVLSEELVPSLKFLGAAYINDENYTKGIKALRRGVHLARVSEGLHTPTQIPLLEQLIAAHLKQGNFTAADEMQNYLYRVKSWKRTALDPEMLEANLRYANWMRSAYLGDLDRERYPRLVAYTDLFDDAIKEIEAAAGEDSPLMLPYLKGRAEAAYLLSVYPGERESGVRISASGANDVALSGEVQLRFMRMEEHNFRYGRKALERARDILEKDPAQDPIELAEAWLALGDWYQWHRKYARAVQHYEQAWRVAQSSSDSDAWYQASFGEPIELPADVIFNPGSVPLQTLNTATVKLRFSVNRHGEAKDITVLTPETSETQVAITRGYHYLRNIRFRPRLQEGLVVAAQDLERTYHIRY